MQLQSVPARQMLLERWQLDIQSTTVFVQGWMMSQWESHPQGVWPKHSAHAQNDHNKLETLLDAISKQYPRARCVSYI